MPASNPAGSSHKAVEVFRPGRFRAMNGGEFAFSEADVAAIADGYDGANSPAPVVVGHPQHDDPAFGWVERFEVNDAGTLVAHLRDLDPAFVEAVGAGRYRKISMKFFAPDASNNPVPGQYYPRHVGFLGGAAPAVSGLAPVQFADADEGELIEVSFSDPAFEEVSNVFRKLREFLIEKFSREEADEALPEYLIRWVADAAQPQDEADQPGFTAPAQQEDELMTNGLDAAALAARAAELDARERDLAHAENVAFADGLVDDGKLLPAQRDGAVALLDQLATQPDEIEFSDAGTQTKLSPAELLRAVLNGAGKVVPMGRAEMGDAPGDASGVAFADPDGLGVDADDLATHQKALAYQRAHPGMAYLDAVSAVQGG